MVSTSPIKALVLICPLLALSSGYFVSSYLVSTLSLAQNNRVRSPGDTLYPLTLSSIFFSATPLRSFSPTSQCFQLSHCDLFFPILLYMRCHTPFSFLSYLSLTVFILYSVLWFLPFCCEWLYVHIHVQRTLLQHPSLVPVASHKPFPPIMHCFKKLQ